LIASSPPSSEAITTVSAVSSWSEEDVSALLSAFSKIEAAKLPVPPVVSIVPSVPPVLKVLIVPSPFNPAAIFASI